MVEKRNRRLVGLKADRAACVSLWEGEPLPGDLGIAMGLRPRSTSRKLTYSWCSWTKWIRGRLMAHHIRFFARSGTGPDCRSATFRLEDEMKREIIN